MQDFLATCGFQSRLRFTVNRKVRGGATEATPAK
jgi:hypothetical protein